ncbi:MAG: HlyC/CorC family transporter [Bacillaceae bacterium]|nr:HlyC/CorC family transporter [Bacillaceae bacterium]
MPLDTFIIVTLNIILVLFLVFLNGFFVAAEFAMVKVRETRVTQLAEEGNRKAAVARRIVHNLDAYLSACQLGITLASLGLGWVGEPAIAELITPLLARFDIPEAGIHTIAFVIAFSIITFLHIVLGELAPKSLAIQRAEGVSLWTAGPLNLFYKVMYPFIQGLNWTANRLLKMLGIELVDSHESAHTEDEIRILMNQSHQKGYIDKTELTLVDNIFDFTETLVREIMIPRTDMQVLNIQSSFEENLDLARKSHHTRYPVVDGDKDHIIGLVHIKDLYVEALKTEGKKLESIIRPVITVPESMSISKLLRRMQKDREQMAIAIDEFGGTAGLVTVEDILEEIVGEIQDEFDNERPIIEKRENAFSIDGRMLLEEVNEHFGTDLHSEEVDTIAGWVYNELGRTPKVGDKVPYGFIEFEIEDTDHLRITRLLLRKKGTETNKETK